MSELPGQYWLNYGSVRPVSRHFLFHDPYLSQQSCKKMEDAARLRVQYLLAIAQNDVVRQQLNIADFIRFPLPLPLPLILSTVLNRLS